MSFTPTQKLKVRKAITDFCVRAETHQNVWNYSQQRAFHGFGEPPEHRHVNDCSGYVSLVFNWAMHQTGLYLADPLGYKYSGYGYTGSEVEWLDDHGVHVATNKYLVGDLVVYGHNRSGSHTAVCRKAGTDTTSVWSSNGAEHSPNPVKLHYHPDPIVGCWRHPALT
jgi:hypothetical protein